MASKYESSTAEHLGLVVGRSGRDKNIPADPSYCSCGSLMQVERRKSEASMKRPNGLFRVRYVNSLLDAEPSCVGAISAFRQYISPTCSVDRGLAFVGGSLFPVLNYGSKLKQAARNSPELRTGRYRCINRVGLRPLKFLLGEASSPQRVQQRNLEPCPTGNANKLRQ